MRIYLAGGMRGYPDHNRPAFNAAAAKLRAEGHVVFNPAELPFNPDWSHGEYMAIELTWICHKADAIALLPGWADSLGARAEYSTAVAIDLKVIELA